ncbi:MAG: glycosyltransferase family 2 protein [Magnetospirillum sp. WYHS-4]
MKVSIIMPAFMAAETIRDAIESVLAQSHQDWELLIVDDGSSDGTAEIANDFTRRDTRIRCRAQDNAGVSAARNVALDDAIGDAIAYLDADDIYLSDHLAVRVRLLELGHEFVFGPVWELKAGRRSVFHGSLFGENTDCVLPLMVMHVRRCVEKTRFDPDLVFEEDLDLWRRLTMLHSLFQFSDPVTAEYRVHDSATHVLYERGGEAAIHAFRRANARKPQ